MASNSWTGSTATRFRPRWRSRIPHTPRRWRGCSATSCCVTGRRRRSCFAPCTPRSVDALFAEAERRGMRIVAGKVLMDRNAPEELRDTAQQGYDESKALIARWHGRGRSLYAITPRFAGTSTPAQLDAAGTLWREHPGVLMQTHISENRREIEWTAELFPERKNYLDVYDHHGLIGKRRAGAWRAPVGGRDLPLSRERCRHRPLPDLEPVPRFRAIPDFPFQGPQAARAGRPRHGCRRRHQFFAAGDHGRGLRDRAIERAHTPARSRPFTWQRLAVRARSRSKTQDRRHSRRPRSRSDRARSESHPPSRVAQRAG